MPWLIDGSNVLGAMHLDRHSDAVKRDFVRQLASFARAKKTRVSCIFDGLEPPSFARHLGAVSVAFSGTLPADDLIAERAANGKGWQVVTSDRGLGERVKRRGVQVVDARLFVSEMESTRAADEEAAGDWESWFADPENREKF